MRRTLQEWADRLIESASSQPGLALPRPRLEALPRRPDWLEIEEKQLTRWETLSWPHRTEGDRVYRCAPPDQLWEVVMDDVCVRYHRMNGENLKLEGNDEPASLMEWRLGCRLRPAPEPGPKAWPGQCGADTLRWCLIKRARPGFPSQERLMQTHKRFVGRLWQLAMRLANRAIQRGNMPERWLYDFMLCTVDQVTAHLEDDDPAGALGVLEDAVRFPALREGCPLARLEAFKTLLRLSAPFVPMIADELYGWADPMGLPSVHLASWPRRR